MGSIIKLSSINNDIIGKLMPPIIFCISEEKLTVFTKEYQVISINGILSRRLLQYEPDKCNLFIADEFDEIISNIDGPILIKDFEILFDPQLQIDVLRLFILANRKKRIAILWCGKYKTGKLIFAEPEYKDYKSYNIKDYDISCIV